MAPLPQIPALMSVSGSQNIFVVAVLHSYAQAQERWGELGVRKLFGASTVKILLGGISDETEFKAYSAPAGEYDEDTESISDSESGTSVSVSTRRSSVLEPAQIRMLKPGDEPGRRAALGKRPHSARSAAPSPWRRTGARCAPNSDAMVRPASRRRNEVAEPDGTDRPGPGHRAPFSCVARWGSGSCWKPPERHSHTSPGRLEQPRWPDHP
nr:TraM recognition domain-containing protein [Streptomyces sp. 846.5]